MSGGVFRSPKRDASANARTNININNENNVVQPNLVELSVDTSGLVDNRQQDSGSNQSGSDSGFGCSNSISSDNSTFTAACQNHSKTFSAGDRNTTNNNNDDSANGKHHALAALPTSAQHTTRKDNKLGSIDETRTKLEDAEHKQNQLFNSNATSAHTDNIGTTTDGCNELVPSPSVPILKSLLKSSSHLLAIAPKHKRKVSFNQTVIVFCEEIVTPSPSDEYEPPIGYEDSLGSFEPPEDYCDQKFEVNDENYGQGSFERDEGPANFTDDQLIQFLEDESLLGKFKLGSEDPGYGGSTNESNFNQNHTYLCDDIISDCDSDSESPAFMEEKILAHKSTPEPDSAQLRPSQTNFSLISGHQNRDKLSQATKEKPHNNSEFKQSEPTKYSPKPANPQKSMPARMKVSTVDHSHLKRLPNRQEDNDLEHESRAPNDRIGSERRLSNAISSQVNVNGRPTSMLVKQSIIDPPTLTKFVNLPSEPSNCTSNIGTKLNVDQTSTSNEVHQKPVDLITSMTNQTRENIPFNQCQPQYPGSSGTSQSQSTCHICKIIESNRSQVCNDPNNLTDEVEQPKFTTSNTNPRQPSHLVYPVQPRPLISSLGQPVFNQSCVTCHATNSAQGSKSGSRVQTTDRVAQTIRPLDCQLVYVIDRSGNRVRALSVVRPNSQACEYRGLQLINGQRIFLAHNNAPIPISKSGCDIAGSAATNTLQLSSNARFIDEKTQCNTSSHNQYAPNSHFSQSLPRNSFAVATPQTLKPNDVDQGVRQHTVYYLRQPLGTQNVSQLTDLTRSSSRSFPQPHEIRRLDGLRAPAKSNNLSIAPECGVTKSQPAESHSNFASKSNEKLNKSTNLSKDDMEDPTFGFSKRPSVKVVTASSECSGQNPLNGSVNTLVKSQASNVRPVSLIVVDSQTLDRPNASFRHRSTTGNLAHTSSVANMHGALTDLSNKATINPSRHQQAVTSQSTITTTPDSDKPKGTSLNNLTRWLCQKLSSPNLLNSNNSQ